MPAVVQLRYQGGGGWRKIEGSFAMSASVLFALSPESGSSMSSLVSGLCVLMAVVLLLSRRFVAAEISQGNAVPESSMCTFSQLSRRTSVDLLLFFFIFEKYAN